MKLIGVSIKLILLGTNECIYFKIIFFCSMTVSVIEISYNNIVYTACRILVRLIYFEKYTLYDKSVRLQHDICKVGR